MTRSKADPRVAIVVGGEGIPPGERRTIEIPLARVPATQLLLSVPVEVIHGARSGPCIWLSAAIHGDELNGIEIIRQVRKTLSPPTLSGTVLAVPIVNGFGFINQSRYLPDRRDLNRSFPGTRRGSLAAQLAAIFLEEVVNHCSHGIDLHTGSDHRTNLPQIRGDLSDAETRRIACAFDAPIAVHAQTRDGSLRDAAARLGKRALVYEAGEPLRFDDFAIESGVRGVLRVMHTLGMLEEPPAAAQASRTPLIVTRTQWVRARASGLLRLNVKLGERVTQKRSLGWISDAFGEMSVTVKAPVNGVVIGHTNNPMVRKGDAIVHLGVEFENAGP